MSLRARLAAALALAAVVVAGAAAGDAATPMQDRCFFARNAVPAFCDTFDEPMPGGRGGDLDPAKWSVTRVSGATNLGQGMFNEFFPATVQYCTTVVPGVVPPNDSFVCGRGFGEANHWMTA